MNSVHEYSRSQLQDPTFSSAQLQSHIEEVVQHLIGVSDPIQGAQSFAATLPLGKFQEAIRLQHRAFPEAVILAKAKLHEALFYLEHTQKQISVSLYTRLSDFLYALLSLVEGMIAAFGVAQFFSPIENESHGFFRSQQIMNLIYNFSPISGILGPILGAEAAGKMIGGFFAVCALLSLIYPKIRPMPRILPGTCENWSQSVRHAHFQPVHGRKTVLDEVAASLVRQENPILLGLTGVGKTQLVRALVQAIERGEYPELRGKEVFYYNCATLIGSSEFNTGGVGSRILTRISEAMGRHRGNIILILDEVHAFFSENALSGPMSEQLKTLLDKGGPNNLPYVVGITTQEEFDAKIKRNAAFVRRFKEVPVGNTTKEETQQIVFSAMLQRAPQVLVAEGAFDAMWNNEEVQPGACLEVLEEALQQTSVAQISPTVTKIEEVKSQIQAAASQCLTSRSDNFTSPVAALNQQLSELEQVLQQEVGQRTEFFHLRDQLAAARKEMFRLMAKVAEFAQGHFSSRQERDINALLFLRQYLVPGLEGAVRRKATQLGIKTVIDAALVNQVKQARSARKEQVQAPQQPSPV
jgi:hypothetical protein